MFVGTGLGGGGTHNPLASHVNVYPFVLSVQFLFDRIRKLNVNLKKIS